MTELSSTVLTFTSSSTRLKWLRKEHPTVDQKLIDELLKEVQHVGKFDTQSILKIANFVADAADLWKDEQTYASAVRLEAVAIRHDEPEKALQKYRLAVTIYERLGLLELSSDATLGIVATLRMLGRYSEALGECEKIIANFTTLGDLYGLGRAYINFGILHSRLGHFEVAQQKYQFAREAFQKLGDTHWLAIADINEANVLEELKQFDVAKEKYIQAQSYFIQLEADEMALKIEHNLAYLYFSLGEYQQALRLFTQVGSQFGQLGLIKNEAKADLYRSEVYIALNQWERALSVVEKIRPIFAESQMVWELGQVLINEAISLSHLERTAEAFDCFEQARTVMPDDQNDQIWQGMVDLYQSTISLQCEQFDDATQLAVRAVNRFTELGIHYRVAQCQQILGDVALRKADFAEAEMQFTNALNIAQTLNLSVLLYGCHHGLGQVYRFQQNFEKAYECYQQSIDSLERLQGLIGAEDYKISYRSDKLVIYHEFVELCLEQDKDEFTEYAFEVIERSRARTILDLVSSQQGTQEERPNSIGTTSQIRKIREELNWYYHQLFTPDQPLDSVEAIAELNREIAERESRLTELMIEERNLDALPLWCQEISVLSVDEIRKQLPEQTTALSYFVVEQSLFVFIVNRDHFRKVQIELPKDSLTELLHQLRFQIDRFQFIHLMTDAFVNSMKESVDYILAQLYDLLLRPVISELGKHTHLVLIPYGSLHYVPFHALHDGSNYVLENYSVSYAPSATFFCLLNRQERLLSKQELAAPLLFGLNDELIDQAEAEVKAIHEYFPEAEAYCNDEFTVARLVENKQMRSIIHLATHGNIRTQYPHLSALKAADGWITLYDIERMSAGAKLITLSACDSGHNAIRPGDELIGFYKSFFASGTNALLLSLWPLHDETAIEIMRTFYQNLSSGQAVCKALHAAQLEQLQGERQHPFFWASFVLIGNPLLAFGPTGSRVISDSPN